MNYHDSGYHLLFSHPEMVADLLQHFVLEDWVQQLDYKHMERINAKFHTDSLKQRDGDLIYRIPTHRGRGEIYLYLLLEFQSRPDKWMALRVMVYVGLLYQQLIKEKRVTVSKQLPPVFPLVLYNGQRKWKHPTFLQDLIGLPSDSPIQKWQPQQQFCLISEHDTVPGNTETICGTLFEIGNSRTINDLQGFIDRLTQQIPDHASLHRAIIQWLKVAIGRHSDLELTLDELENLAEVKIMLKTRIDQWRNEIREEGREEGRAKGREEGKVAMLLSGLELKFGEVPPRIKEQVQSATDEQLQQWYAKLFRENSLEDVFK